MHDLLTLQQKSTETLVDFLIRWRNLSMKCEPSLQENHSVALLLGHLTGPIALLLKLSSVHTF